MQLESILAPLLLLLTAMSLPLFLKVITGTYGILRPNLWSITVYYHFLLQSVLGALLISLELQHRGSLHIVDGELALIGAVSVAYAVLAFLFSVGAIYTLTGDLRTGRKFRTWLSERPKSCGQRIGWILCIVVAAAGALYVYMYTPVIALGELLSGAPAHEVAVARVQSKTNFHGSYILRNMCVIFGFIAACAAFSRLLIRRCIFDWAVFLTLFGLAFWLAAYTVEKSPPLWLLLSLLLVAVAHGFRLRIRHLVVVFGVLVAAVLALYAWVAGYGIDALALLSNPQAGPVGRILYGQITGTYWSLHVFPDLHPFLGFSTVMDFFSAHDSALRVERSSRILMEYANTKEVLTGEANVMNSLFIAEAWSNWGAAGIIVAPIYVAGFVVLIMKAITSLPKTSALLGAYAYIATHLPITGGINDFVWPSSFVSIALATVLLSAISNDGLVWKFCRTGFDRQRAVKCLQKMPV